MDFLRGVGSAAARRTTGVLAVVALLHAATVAADQWITFSSAPASVLGPGIEGGAALALSPVRGYLGEPIEPGRHPAVVMMPGCEGLKLYQQAWAAALAERGYFTLAIDNYFMHDRGQTCGITDPRAIEDLRRMRELHALGAATYLAGLANVDGRRIAVMGWDDAPVLSLIAPPADAGPGWQELAAAVMVTPSVCNGEPAGGAKPLLVLRAGSGARGCVEADVGARAQVVVYEGTLPGFDDPRAGSGAAGRRYDRLAHARAIEDVVAFLGRHLRAAGAARARAGKASAPEGIWAVDPNDPGPDLPPSGASAFDRIFSRATPGGAVYDVPYPFEHLLDALARAAGGAAMSRTPFDTALVPLGRSLQREAAAPDYFASPRIVVAVTGEPADGARPPVRLANRLFIGYQPRIAALEVISYNAAARRFEFQVVRDYRPGGEPLVGYARRALCTSCHQNQGPMFPEAGWSETNANPRIARRLAALGERFHGVRLDASDRSVAAIDTATNEGNLLAVYQRLWAEGCAAAQPREVARCRAGAFLAMLQYRLSGAAGFDPDGDLYRSGYLALQRRNWAARWPRGLLVPSPNLPDRAPLMSPSPSLVPAALDPLRSRPPMAHWRASKERDLARMVRGLAASLRAGDIARLDTYLRGAGAADGARRLDAACSVLRRGFAGGPALLQVDCGEVGDVLGLKAQLQIESDGAIDGEAGWLEVGGGTYSRLVVAGQFDDDGPRPRAVVHFRHGFLPLNVRASDGGALLAATLDWDRAAAGDAARFDAHLSLEVAADFVPVREALERLAEKPGNGSPLLDEHFDDARLVDQLLASLGAKSATPCCDEIPVPAPRLDEEGAQPAATLSVALEHRGPLQTFRRFCGPCHGGRTVHPPGFLHGDAEANLAAVRRCAPRIFYRLSMWHVPVELRGTAPMPPPQGLAIAGLTAGEWQRSEALERLTGYARGILVDQGLVDPEALLKRAYADTRACPAADAAARNVSAETRSGRDQ